MPTCRNDRSEAVTAVRAVVVDDHPDSADMLVELLALRGIDARAAYDGAAALDLVALVAPGLVLVDLSLPGIDGYEVARRIRGTEPAAAMQLIAVTGWADPESRERALGAGFDELMVKPVDVEAILRIADGPATSE